MSKTDAQIRIRAFLPYSRANGPGARAVLWTQGCTLGCAGCFNPESHPFNGGEEVSVDDLFQRVAQVGDRIEGITVSGGEPFQQLQPLLSLLRRVRAETNLSILLFTGYTWREVGRMPEAKSLLSCVDALIAGRYDQTQRLARDLRGSVNKTVHFLSGRYRWSDLQAVAGAELIISAEGVLTMSGIDPLRW
jgi:anaerobic ribonucleoside-triphosphate reductase activating protein